MRFVIVGTMLRGALNEFEPLDKAGQHAATRQRDLDERGVRENGVLIRPKSQPRRDEARVVWTEEIAKRELKVEYRPLTRVRRMLELAEKAKIA